MTFYVTYDVATGALTGPAPGTGDPGAPAVGRAVRAYDAAPPGGATWDPVARDYVTRAGLLAGRDRAYAEWQQAKAGRAEVLARAVPGDQPWATGPTGQGFLWEQTAWAAYRAAFIAWAQAS